MNNWRIIAILSIALSIGMLLGNFSNRNAHAQSHSQQCEWAYITDTHRPEIPDSSDVQKGEIKGKMDENWTTMSKNGFRLVTSTDVRYLFERCR